MNIKKLKISDLLPDPQNANKGTERGRRELEKSLQKYGFGRSLLLDKHGNILAGNKTHEVAGAIGLEEVLVVEVDGNQVVAVQRVDLDLNDPRAKELAIADNRVAELDLQWDAEMLQELENQGVDVDLFWSEQELDALLKGIDAANLDIDAEVSGSGEGKGDSTGTDCECPACGYRWLQPTTKKN